MKKAGFETIRLGLESSSDEFHRQTGGKTTRQHFLDAVNNMRDAGFSRSQIGVYLLVGLPGQSTGRIEDDIDLVLHAGATPRLAGVFTHSRHSHVGGSYSGIPVPNRTGTALP